jgi:SagB-type dehydrogenase family enzyme
VTIFREQPALPTGQPAADTSIGELFYENTKLRHYMAAPGATESQYHLAETDAMSRAYKRYRQRPVIALPPISVEREQLSVREVISTRRTRRTFALDSVTLQEISSILQLSYGITGQVRTPGGGIQTLRAAPSAGALYPAEMYVAARDVAGLEAGIYHYDVHGTNLALLHTGDVSKRLTDICCGQPYAEAAAFTVLISGVVQRTTRKYGDRGYRYVLMDIGHLGQNLYLSCTALDLSIVTTCAFYDDDAAQLLRIDGCDESVFYVGFVGRSVTARPDGG